jgi:hypothetical protein
MTASRHSHSRIAELKKILMQLLTFNNIKVADLLSMERDPRPCWWKSWSACVSRGHHGSLLL